MNETKIKRTKITIETHSITIIRTTGKSSSSFCERCQTNVTAFAPKQIAAILQLDLTEICRLVETDELHLIETRRGARLRQFTKQYTD